MSTKLETKRTVERLKTIWYRELIWMAPALVAAVLIYYTYLTAHPYPSFGAGLFLEIAEQISAHGYGLPERIPHYAPGGIPLAYPPLTFYMVAAISDLTGASGVAISRFLPGLATVLYLFPVYLIARQVLPTRPQASFATLLVAVSPPILQWHISAGGLVRGYAFLFAIAGTYTGVKLFKTGEKWWVVPSLLLFSATVLSHPLYTAFFVLTYLVLFVAYDRTVSGLIAGSIVGFGALIVTAPWWVQVIMAHGPGVFTAAAGTHGGIGKGIDALVSSFGHHPVSAAVNAIWAAIPVAGVIYLLRLRRYFIATWFVTIGLLLGNARFTFLIGAFAATPLVFEVLIPLVKRETRSAINTQNAAVFSIALVATFGMGAGMLYATSQMQSHAGSASQPAFIDDHDVQAMEWVHSQTGPKDRFVVMGDAAEWFPHMAERTILIGPWGVEWKSTEAYQRQLTLYRDISTCGSAACLTATLEEADIHPTYIYVPRDGYTVRGMHVEPDPGLREDLLHSDRYTMVFENQGVMIFRVKGSLADARTDLAPLEGIAAR